VRQLYVCVVYLWIRNMPFAGDSTHGGCRNITRLASFPVLVYQFLLEEHGRKEVTMTAVAKAMEAVTKAGYSCNP
jgi:hypothetical protein